MFQAIASLYDNVRCAVKVNRYMTEWFDVKFGLKQDCLLSTTMFNLYIDDLSKLLDNTGKGIIINGKNVIHLFYADDLVPVASSWEWASTHPTLPSAETWAGRHRS